MPTVKDMLDTYPRTFNVDADLLAQTIEALLDCANTCSQCADACLSESDVTKLAKCIRLNLDCAFEQRTGQVGAPDHRRAGMVKPCRPWNCSPSPPPWP